MGSLSGGGKVIKYLVFIFNFFFFLIGCGLIGIGAYARAGKSKYVDLTEEISTASEYITVSNLFIAVGVIAVVVSFFGCCGAFTENTCMLLIFFSFLLLIFILEIAACIIGFSKKDEVKDQLSKDFQNAIREKYSNATDDDSSATKKVIDEFQTEFECCGYNGYTDWRYSAYHNSTGKLPKSCCKKNAVNCPTADSTLLPLAYNTEGCFKKVEDWVKDNMAMIGSAAIAFAIIQILGIVFSMMLYCSIKRAGEVA